MAQLKRSLGMPALIALGVAGVVGSSWIYTNSEFFAKYGAGGMILGLLLGAALAACIALAYAELTTLLPRAGGEVVWTYTALGRVGGFATGWLHIGAYVASLSFYVTAFGFLLAKVVPQLETFPLYEINGKPVYLPVLVLGVVLTLAVFAMNWVGVRLGGQVQVVLLSVMVLIGLALAVVGFAAGSPDNFLPPFAPDQNPLQSVARFTVPGITYIVGFSLVATLSEESRITPRQVGRAVVLTVACAAAFYTLVLVATAWVLPWERVATMERGTISAFTEAGYPWLGTGAFLIAVLGLVTSFIGLFVASSRITLALARARVLPKAFARIDADSGVPRRALVFILVATLAFGWLGPGAITWFLDAGGVFLGIVWTLVVLAKYRLPRRYPGLRYEYRARPGWLPALGALGAILVIAFALWPGTDLSLVWPAEHLILASWILLGCVLYALTPRPDTDEVLKDMLGDQRHKLDRGRVPSSR